MSGLTDWVTDVVDRLGYVGVALLVALENLFPPIPSEIILPLAGFLTGQGRANYFGMVLAATIGSVVGALALYAVAAWFGEARLRAFVATHGRWFRLAPADLDKADRWFDRYSTHALLFGRCIPLIRSLVSLPAGLRRTPLPRFVLYTAIGSTVWNAALIGAGWALGDNWERVEDWVGYLQYVVVAAMLFGLGWYLWRRFVHPAPAGE